jgi:hypothetical protein
MHNIDRTQLEYPGELYETGYEQYEYPGEMYEASYGEFGAPGEFYEGESGEGGYGYPGEMYEAGYGEFGAPGEIYENGYGELGYEQYEYPGEAEFGGQSGEVFTEQEEIALAAELLEINSEAELDQFLGRLAKRAAGAIGRAVTPQMRRQLLGILKGAAKKALPIAGTAVGNLIAPGIGGMWGGRLGAAAGAAFGLELEGLSAEDQEFEVARRFVRMSGDAILNATQQPAMGSPVTAAQRAVLMSAQRHAPGLAAELSGTFESEEAEFGGYAPRRYGQRSRGQWFRRGNSIVLVGA